MARTRAGSNAGYPGGRGAGMVTTTPTGGVMMDTLMMFIALAACAVIFYLEP